jgi:DNA-binding NtrC family response regulator
MNIPPVVLLYGHDEMLLLTRSLVFQQAGYRVNTARELQESSPLLGKGHVDLVVLCYTLSHAECVTAGRIAKNRSEVPTLLITAYGEGQDCSLREVADADCDSFLGPAAMVAEADRMLEIVRQRILEERMEEGVLDMGAAWLIRALP